MSIKKEFTKGFTTHLAPFRLVLGLCPSLAVTTSLEGGLGMGIATTFVLIMSNLLISLFRKLIPSKVRIAAFITIISGFVVLLELLMNAYLEQLYNLLGVFVSLIVVNCIVLGRAEAFAKNNKPFISVIDGLGVGLGFTLSLTLLGSIRELLGKGSLTLFSKTDLAVQVIPKSGDYVFKFALEPSGAFVMMGLLLMAFNLFNNTQKEAV